MTALIETPFTRQLGIATPLICGPLYPCSNPELVAAVSAAGAIGVVQPISLTYVHGHEFRAGLRLIERLSGGKPFGFNALIEASSQTYIERMRRWVDIALEEGVRFFIGPFATTIVDRLTREAHGREPVVGERQRGSANSQRVPSAAQTTPDNS